MEEKTMKTPRSSSISTVSSFNFSRNLLLRFRGQRTSGTGSILSLHRGPLGIGIRQRYANTYRLESKNPFNRDKVTNIIKDVLESELSGLKKYDLEECRKLGNEISQEIRSRVRLLDFDRYRIVARVNIVEKLKQGVHISLCFLWDSERDEFVSYPYENSVLRAVGTVYGIYYE